MAWDDQIFRYCERAGDPAFWAEPINAVSNGAFIIAGLMAARELRRNPAAGLAEGFLIALVFAMGIGSFLFHTYATRWASYADTIPIGVFMIAYLVYTLRRYVAASWLAVLVAVAAFVWSLQVAGSVHCAPALLPVTAAANGPCLNGTAGYVPAFVVLLGLGALLGFKGHPVARYFQFAAATFLVSMTFRTLDWELCALTRIAGRALGTHVLWHILNATTLYLLLLGAIRHGRQARPA